jgi:hypothetical protein
MWRNSVVKLWEYQCRSVFRSGSRSGSLCHYGFNAFSKDGVCWCNRNVTLKFRPTFYRGNVFVGRSKRTRQSAQGHNHWREARVLRSSVASLVNARVEQRL